MIETIVSDLGNVLLRRLRGPGEEEGGGHNGPAEDEHPLYVPLDDHHAGEVVQAAEDDGGGGESGEGRY